MIESGGDRHYTDLAALHIEYLGTITDGLRLLAKTREAGAPEKSNQENWMEAR
jgi:hypothetical protein